MAEYPPNTSTVPALWRKRASWFALCCSACAPALADPLQSDVHHVVPVELEEVVVTATRSPRPIRDTPYTVHRIGHREVTERLYRTLPQALRNVPGVMVQETSPGQGSPYIRGFTGYRNLFLIDGIRLNNSAFRDGPNQYWSTVDVYGVERLEVVSGPGSVLYGSDAIGGTVNALTMPALNPRRRVLYRHATAEHADLVRVDWGHQANDTTGLRIGLTAKQFGDLEGGRDVGRQQGIGYDEFDAELKFQATLGRWDLDLFHQRVAQEDVPRTHRTVFARSWQGSDAGDDLRRVLDQDRTLSYLRGRITQPLPGIDDARVTLSLATADESRDRLRTGGREDQQGFSVATFGVDAQFVSAVPTGQLIYGIDYYRDGIDSFSSTNAIQGPIGDNGTYSTFDQYLQHSTPFARHGELILGLRHTSARATIDSVLDPVTGGRISLDDHWSTLIGNVRISYGLGDQTRLFAGVSQGFRAPNVSDLSRFDSSRSNEFEIPAPGLEPERYVTYEFGMKLRKDVLDLQASWFYTTINDMIIRFPTGLVRDGEFEITKSNVGEGFVRGIELDGEWTILPDTSLRATFTWMDGEVDTYPSSVQLATREPIDRLMPLTASLGVRWRPSGRRYWVESDLMHAATQDQLSTRDAGDRSRIPPGGTPRYTIWHLRGGYRLTEATSILLAIDNLTNEDYRVHGSGTNMPGRNAVASIEIVF